MSRENIKTLTQPSMNKLHEMFDLAWEYNKSDETRTELSRMVTSHVTHIMQDYSWLVGMVDDLSEDRLSEIAEAERSQNDGWVPCIERLPKEEKQYEVTIRRKHESFNRVGARHFVKPSYSARGVWLDSSLCETVLAWRDMPKPWKGEE